MYKIKRYFSGVLKQAKMVRWPKKTDLITSFAVVLVILVFSAIALTIDDYVISQILNVLNEQFGDNAATSSAAIRTLLSLFR